MSNSNLVKLFNMMNTESVSLQDIQKHVDAAVRYYTNDLYSLKLLEQYGAVTYSSVNGTLMRFASMYYCPSDNKYKLNSCSNYFTVAIDNSVLGTGVSQGLRSEACLNKQAFVYAIAKWLEEWLVLITQSLMENNRRALLSM